MSFDNLHPSTLTLFQHQAVVMLSYSSAANDAFLGFFLKTAFKIRNVTWSLTGLTDEGCCDLPMNIQIETSNSLHRPQKDPTEITQLITAVSAFLPSVPSFTACCICKHCKLFPTVRLVRMKKKNLHTKRLLMFQ